MKARKTLTLLLLAALTFAACKYDDSALWEQVNQNTEELAAQAARIAALEAWQAETNTNIGRIPVACTQITLGNVSEGQLAKLIGSRTDLTTITVTSGTLNGADWNAIRRNEWTLRTLLE